MSPLRSLFWLVAAMAGLAVFAGISTTAGQDDENAALSPGSESGLVRLREGTTIVDEPGTFQLVGKRLVFVCDGEPRQLVALENLALERVLRLVQRGATPHAWLVSGTVTEYQGSNYLLIERAVIRRTGEISAPAR